MAEAPGKSYGLVIDYGEGGREAIEVLPLLKGGAEKVLAMLKGGGGAQQVLR